MMKLYVLKDSVNDYIVYVYDYSCK